MVWLLYYMCEIFILTHPVPGRHQGWRGRGKKKKERGRNSMATAFLLSKIVLFLWTYCQLEKRKWTRTLHMTSRWSAAEWGQTSVLDCQCRFCFTLHVPMYPALSDYRSSYVTSDTELVCLVPVHVVVCLEFARTLFIVMFCFWNISVVTCCWLQASIII